MITVLEKLWKIAECRALSWSALALECIWPYGWQLWGYRKESRGEIVLEKSQYSLKKQELYGMALTPFCHSQLSQILKINESKYPED